MLRKRVRGVMKMYNSDLGLVMDCVLHEKAMTAEMKETSRSCRGPALARQGAQHALISGKSHPMVPSKRKC